MSGEVEHGAAGGRGGHRARGGVPAEERRGAEQPPDGPRLRRRARQRLQAPARRVGGVADEQRGRVEARRPGAAGPGDQGRRGELGEDAPLAEGHVADGKDRERDEREEPVRHHVQASVGADGVLHGAEQQPRQGPRRVVVVAAARAHGVEPPYRAGQVAVAHGAQRVAGAAAVDRPGHQVVVERLVHQKERVVGERGADGLQAGAARPPAVVVAAQQVRRGLRHTGLGGVEFVLGGEHGGAQPRRGRGARRVAGHAVREPLVGGGPRRSGPQPAPGRVERRPGRQVVEGAQHVDGDAPAAVGQVEGQGTFGVGVRRSSGGLQGVVGASQAGAHGDVVHRRHRHVVGHGGPQHVADQQPRPVFEAVHRALAEPGRGGVVAEGGGEFGAPRLVLPGPFGACGPGRLVEDAQGLARGVRVAEAQEEADRVVGVQAAAPVDACRDGMGLLSSPEVVQERDPQQRVVPGVVQGALEQGVRLVPEARLQRLAPPLAQDLDRRAPQGSPVRTRRLGGRAARRRPGARRRPPRPAVPPRRPSGPGRRARPPTGRGPGPVRRRAASRARRRPARPGRRRPGRCRRRAARPTPAGS
ncbi:hypothetical protein RB200_24120 [Streptomyces sp. PmtG]